MRKVVISLLAAGSLLLTNTAIHANVTEGQASQTAAPWTSVNEDSSYTYEAVEQVSASKATIKKGTFKTKYNTNIRRDAGTKHSVVTLAKKGSTATATHQKKVGNQTWYKVKVNGKTGWVLSTLLTPAKAAAKAPAKKAPAKKATVNKVSSSKATASNGTYKVKHNSNVRSNAGTKNKIVTLARKGTTVKSTHQTKVGNTVWYKISANGKTGWISGTLLTKTTVKAKAPAKKKATKKASNSSAPSNLVSNAKSHLGTPYKFGGTTTSGFDCSGYIQYVFNQSGKKVSRTTLGQFAESKTVSTPQVGDLVFFAGTYRAGISHVGIYIGNNQFIHAGGRKTEVVSLNNSYWKKHFHSFKRL
ncbi:C40 family peptidase [Sporosarcina sp. G11-34]|uniref:C40 family peptidase n=1 Tax=Sporosarcina sp. G11-34 TaxID=2849605 RepID=UPI0022A95524|nr:C40 family peptidase [Sporosarcina sp. G11-34]MCZ2258646.1 C40 family peptidase [Sporosarcina sp. G11-34]